MTAPRGPFEALGLYVHIPYCETHCPYCDFNVRVEASFPERRYTDALVAELEHHADRPPWRGATIATIYFGGGTPSLFSAGSVSRVLDAVAKRFRVADRGEATLEANPGTLSLEGLRELRVAGIDRLSLGIQSFQPRALKVLGRLQTAEDTLRAVPAARGAGFDDVSLDLMFAIPGQSLEDWRSDLDRATSFAPDHLSAYNLTYEEGTPFFAMRREGRLLALDDELEAEMFEEARHRLGAAGYRAYEVSNFARPGHESRHNLNYWRAGAYLGIGAGAHSHAPLPSGARRLANERDPDAYVRRVLRDGSAVATEERLASRQSAGEFAFLGLRLADGFAEDDFVRRFGTGVDEIFPGTPELVRSGLLERSHGRLALTRRGLLVADSVFASFV